MAGVYTPKRNTGSCLPFLGGVAKLHRGHLHLSELWGWKNRRGLHMALGGSWPGGLLQGLCCHVLPQTAGKQLPLPPSFLVPFICSLSSRHLSLSSVPHSGSYSGGPMASGIRGTELERPPGTGTPSGPGLISEKLEARALDAT